jgi:signal transduction histidine kinase
MDEQQIAGYTVQHDMHGEPALLLRVVSPRTITAQGQANLHYMLLALLAVGLVFGAVSLWLLERFVLARLSHLNASVTSIADNAMLDTRIEVQGNDELAHLGATMNQMFDALERSYRHQGDVNVQLQSSRDLLRAIFDTIDDGLLLLDHRGNVLAANQAMSLLFSRTSKDLFGQSWERLCRLPLPGACSAQMHFPGLWVLDTLRDGQPRQQRERLSCNDRSIRVFDMQAMPIYHGKAIDESPRQVSQVVLHVIDVTEQLQMEAMMVDTARLTANKRLSQIVAHEVNSPLQTILFSLEMMQDAEATERHRFLNVAQSEVERIGKILHQLKDLYHRQSDERSLTDINMLVERVLLLVSGTLARHEIEVERCLTPNVPLLRASGDQLMQVLLNLTLNALDAMPNGGRLRVSSFFAEYALPQQLDAAGNGATPHDMHHTCLAIEIADTGSGMEPAVQARIFEPFYTTKTDGSGLGLAVCHKIIEEHDGCIDVESRHGAGTTFRILLPCSAKEQP